MQVSPAMHVQNTLFGLSNGGSEDLAPVAALAIKVGETTLAVKFTICKTLTRSGAEFRAYSTHVRRLLFRMTGIAVEMSNN